MLRTLASGCCRRIYTCLVVPARTRGPGSILGERTTIASAQHLHTTCSVNKDDPIRHLARKTAILDDYHMKEDGEVPTGSSDLQNFDAMFPTEDTPNIIIQGTAYKDLPVVYINASSNNIIITLTNAKGRSIASSSAGAMGFKNRRKATAVAAQVTSITVAKQAKRRGLYAVRVTLNGIGLGREAALRTLVSTGLTVASITDVTPIPFNGNRPPNKRSL